MMLATPALLLLSPPAVARAISGKSMCDLCVLKRELGAAYRGTYWGPAGSVGQTDSIVRPERREGLSISHSVLVMLLVV